MSTIALVGGAGMMGQGIARDLLSSRAIIDIEHVRICDVAGDRADALRDTLADPRVQLRPTDVTDDDALRHALDGADLIINAVPTLAGHQLRIFEAALAAGVDYCDLGGLGSWTVRQLAYADRFREAGVTAVLGVGSDPGMSNVLCRAVADRLDTIDSINLYWAAELVGDENPLLVPPYAVSTVLAEYARPSVQFIDGQHCECPPLGGEEVLELPEPWGRASFYFSPHSEQLTVPLAPGIAEKGITEFTWRLHLPRREHEAWVGLVKAGFGDFDRPVTVNDTQVRPLDVLEAVMQRHIAENEARIPPQESHEIHLAIARGTRGGERTVARAQAILRPHPMYDGYIDAGTSMNASIAAQLMLRGPARPGVWAPESYFDPAPYFAEVEKRHMEVTFVVEPGG